MKVKWTTITEDESTWPRVRLFLIENDGDGSRECFISGGFLFVGPFKREFPDDCIGYRWRPMPKPPKKNKRCSCFYSSNVFHHDPRTGNIIQSNNEQSQEMPKPPKEEEKPSMMSQEDYIKMAAPGDNPVSIGGRMSAVDDVLKMFDKKQSPWRPINDNPDHDCWFIMRSSSGVHSSTYRFAESGGKEMRDLASGWKEWMEIPE